jgi:signal transduction histidine kinase
MIVLLYVTALLNFLLGAYTFFTSSRNRKAIFFFLITLGISGWAVTNAQFQISVNAEEMFTWAILAYQAAGLLLFFVKLFSYEVINRPYSFGQRSFILSFAAMLFSVIAPVVPGVVALGVDFNNKAIIGGPLQPLLFVAYIYLMVSSLNSIYQARKSVSGIAAKQLSLIFWGLFGAITAALFTNIILPALGIYIAVTLGPTFTLFFLALIAYSIVRHRLFDTRVIVGRITYFIILGLFSYVFFYSISIFYELSFENGVFNPAAMLIGVLVSIIFVFLFNGVNRYIREQVNSRFINAGYDPLETNDRFGRDLSLIVKLPDIVTRMTDVISRTIRPEAFWLYLLATEAKSEALLNHQPFEKLPRLAQLCLMVWQNVGKHPLVIDEFKIETERGGLFTNIVSIIKELEQIMLDQDIKVILSMDGSEGIIGFYAFGMKEADSPYTTQDIEFIISLVNTASLAINRSLLYAEVQDFAASLQRKVDEATAELKETNAKLESTLIEVQDARRKEQDMVDIMGHELRTPMSIVRNAVKVLLFELRKPTEVKRDFFEKYLEMAFESAKREITLIETLLSATKLDASRVQLHFTRIDGKDIVHDSLEGQRAILSERNMQVEYREPKGVFDVFADRTRIQEVMDNFLSNAVKYTPKGTVRINLWKDPDFVWISVADQGIGIGADDLQNLGKKFFRAKQYVRVEGKDQIIRPGGTGLGLYVSFELTRLIGGQLYINSQVGKGSTFTFSIPLYKDQPDKQIDQTFDTPEETNQRRHVIIGGNPPTPPADMEYETPEPVLFPSQEDIEAHMATMKAQP